MRALGILVITGLGALFAACELTLGLDDKTFCDDAPEGCPEQQSASSTSSSVGGGGGTGGSSTSTGGGGQGGGDCTTLTFDEEWENGALATWSTLDADNDIFDPMGALQIEPDTANDFWWDNEQAPFVYREVCGDFGVHIHIDTIDPTTSLMPSLAFNGGGILVRNPNPGATALNEHWLLLSHGYQSEAIGAGGYWSGPDDGGNFLPESTYPVPVLGAQLSLCRFQGEWHGYVLPDCTNEPIILFQASATNIDLPDRVQVGVTVHQRTSGEKVKGAFRWTNLFRPQSLQECFDILDETYIPSYTCP